MSIDKTTSAEHLRFMRHLQVNTCKSCGTNLDFNQCFCNAPRGQQCELGEHCRCVEGDEPGCWNWIGKAGL